MNANYLNDVLTRRVKLIEEKFLRGEPPTVERRYWRFSLSPHKTRTFLAFSCGCFLNCVFCYVNPKFLDPELASGSFFTPSQVATKLVKAAFSKGFLKIGISGGEPIIPGKAFQHLVSVLENIEKLAPNLPVVVETNGIFLGLNDDLVYELSRFNNLQVRVSFKGASPNEFSLLTGADPELFDLTLEAVRNLVENAVNCSCALMSSFSSEISISKFIYSLREISPLLVKNLEVETLILYPLTVKKLRKHKIKWREAIHPKKPPAEMI